jgi:hypothetical protein
MKNKERIAILETEISRLKVANRTANERLTLIEGELGITEIPEGTECVANNSAPNEGHLREHIDNFFNPKGDNAINSFEAKIMQEFGEMKSGEPKQVKREDIANGMAKIMADVQNAIEPITPDFIPDWKDAPEDAVCVAMDKEGEFFWYKNIPKIGRVSFVGDWVCKIVGHATNTDLLPTDYWKSTLMMRSDAVKDYTHLLPEGYEFCSEEDAEKWVKVENPSKLNPLGHIWQSIIDPRAGGMQSEYRPIRPIQYKVTTHEIVTAVPDPYMPDWSKAPEGTVAHAWDMSGIGRFYYIDMGDPYPTYGNILSNLTLPAALDWKQSLRVKPSK